MPGGWMGDVAVPTPLVLNEATFWLYTDPEKRLGKFAPAPKLKLFWRMRSWNMAPPARRDILPSPNTSQAMPRRGSRNDLAGENPGLTPEHGSQFSPTPWSAVRGLPTMKPLLKLMAGFWAALYLLRSTLYSVQLPSPPGVPPRTTV